jgi:SAM-dependent methyltransferase
VPDNVYFAHLSIYQFATRFCQDRVVLDAGSGAGYGAAYLASHGARQVVGIDVDEASVAFSQEHFQAPHLEYRVMDLGGITGLAHHSFDTIFTSNTLEHVADLRGFFRSAWLLLKAEGTLIVAVPPITNDYLRAANVANPFHLHIWSPWQWYHTLGQYFGGVECYGHYLGSPGVLLDFNRPQTRAVPSEEWVFEQATLDQLAAQPTLTALFVARRPVPESTLPAADEMTQFVDGSFSRVPGDRTTTLLSELLARREGYIQQLEARIAEQEQAIQERPEAARVRKLEAAIATKDAHILACEDLIRRLQEGRVMRFMSWLARLHGK